MNDLLKEVLGDNPVLAETWRPFHRARQGKNWKANTIVTAILVTVVYGSLLAGGLQIVETLEASVFLMILVVLGPLFTATILYPTLAAEREKKTMDLLLVAPVTAAQIVTAKLARVLWPMTGLVITLIVPAVVFALVRISRGLPPGNETSNFWLGLNVTLLISACSAWFVSGMSLCLSSVNRTTSGALTAVIGGLFTVYGVLPVFAAALSPISRHLSEAFVSYHPVFATARALWRSNSELLPIGLIIAICVAFHLIGGSLFMWMTVNNVEGERKKGSKLNA